MQSLQDIDWPSLINDKEFYPSPMAWQDELLYFLFVDRFSDCREYGGFANLSGAIIQGPTTERTTSAFETENTVDHCIHPPGSRMACLLSTDPSGHDMTVDIEERNGSAVYLTIPPAGIVILH